MELADRLSRALAAHNPRTIRMMGGLCYMLNGNMALGTYKGGLMVRISKADYAAALERDGAREMVMKDRVMEGFILVDADAVERDEDLANWVRLALAYNKTLPPKPEKAAKKAPKKARH
jgi:TfoX/Sxy family transcriptional regulator of competence genes